VYTCVWLHTGGVISTRFCSSCAAVLSLVDTLMPPMAVYTSGVWDGDCMAGRSLNTDPVHVCLPLWVSWCVGRWSVKGVGCMCMFFFFFAFAACVSVNHVCGV